MFCSVSCRNSAVGKPTTEVKEAVSPPKIPKLDRKMILQKLRNMIELKRSKLLQSEKTDSKDDLNKPNTLENSSIKPKLNIEINDEHKFKIPKTPPIRPKTTAKKNVVEKKLKISCPSPAVKNYRAPPRSIQEENSIKESYLKVC